MLEMNITIGAIPEMMMMMKNQTYHNVDNMNISFLAQTTVNIETSTMLSLTACIVLSIIILTMEFLSNTKESETSTGIDGEQLAPKPPGPKPLPIIGNLACMGGYEVPYQAFDVLAKKFGPIISLKLGSVQTVVVNGIDNIKEVLITKTTHFDSRPNFRRYHDLFSGNKQNSLAFCNWSDVQKMRRDMLTQHSFPRNFSARFESLNDIIINQMQNLVNEIKSQTTMHGPTNKGAIEIKPIFMITCANIFTEYYCSRSFCPNDKQFADMIKNYDQIFWEVNQGYACDFLPFLLPFHLKNMRRMEKCTREIREFILANIIEDRLDTWVDGDTPNDYVESIIDHFRTNLEPKMEWNTALFSLEDIIGGHSAIGNFMVKVFGFVGRRPEVQQKIQNEIDERLAGKTVGNTSSIELSDRPLMPYTESVIMEALRLIASPIVPHVANQNSTIAGFHIAKDSLIFLNNYDLSMNEELWDEPTEFRPERFIHNGHVVKPDHFLPFGAGRRACMGYKMVHLISFAVLANCMQSFNMSPKPGTTHKIQVGSLAVPEKCYEMVFDERM